MLRGLRRLCNLPHPERYGQRVRFDSIILGHLQAIRHSRTETNDFAPSVKSDALCADSSLWSLRNLCVRRGRSFSTAKDTKDLQKTQKEERIPSYAFAEKEF